MTDPQSPAPNHAPLTDEELSELGKGLGLLVHHIMRARQDTEAGRVSVLSVLAKCGPVRASELAKKLLLDLSTVSRHVQGLERAGLVEKTPDPTDGRATNVHLTAAGKDEIEQIWQRRLAMMREGLSHWDPAELRTFARLLSQYSEDFTAILAKGADKTHDHGTTTEEDGH